MTTTLRQAVEERIRLHRGIGIPIGLAKIDVDARLSELQWVLGEIDRISEQLLIEIGRIAHHDVPEDDGP